MYHFHDLQYSAQTFHVLHAPFLTRRSAGGQRWQVLYHGYITNSISIRGPIYKISYDLAYDYRKFIVRSTYDSDLKRAEISLRNIVS